MSEAMDLVEGEEKEKKLAIEKDKEREREAAVVADVAGYLVALSSSREGERERETKRRERVTATLWALRRRMTWQVLRSVAGLYVRESDAEKWREAMEQAGEKETEKEKEKMEIDSAEKEKEKEKEKEMERIRSSDDCQAYLQLLLASFLIDTKAYSAAVDFTKRLVCSLPSLSLSGCLLSRVYFLFFRSHELNGSLHDIRSTLMEAFQTSQLRHEEELRSTLLHLILRLELHFNRYSSADHFISHVDISESQIPSNQYARLAYYIGKIKAIQLKYDESLRYLQIALRKAPQKALGFRVAVTQLLVLIQLLTGQIPDRSTFSQGGLRKPLAPYLDITKSVRTGNTIAFRVALEEHRTAFMKDGLLTLVHRVHHNVLKTGLRTISAAYSRISIADVSKKLAIDGLQEAEFIIAKAIRDRVISATIVRDDLRGNYVECKESGDDYTTQRPADVFHERIQMFLNVRNESVRALRYPEKATAEEDEKAKEMEEERKERVKAEQEIPEMDDEEDEM